MTDKAQREDGMQNGPGEQIRLQDDRQNGDRDDLPDGANPSGGRSAEIRRDNIKARPGGAVESEGTDTTPLSTPGDGRRTEDDLAQAHKKTVPAEGVHR